MDRIYQNAHLTIIAAAGINEHYGLPGLGNTKRTTQPTARVGNLTIISTLKDIQRSILTSKWSTRGWTFQEALLSRRRLVFTDEQMYFECGAINCYESLSTSLDSMHDTSMTGFKSLRSDLRPGMFMMDRERPCEFDNEKLYTWRVFLRYLSVIGDYTTRELRFDYDSLNAFAGVMHKFEKLRNPVFQIWGIPIVFCDTEEETQQYFMEALCWSHCHSSWDDSSKPYRRPDFPSWSWAGWAGAATYKNSQFWSDRAGLIIKLGPLSLECDSGNILRLRQVQTEVRTAYQLGAPAPRILRMSGRAIPGDEFSYDEQDGWKVFKSSATVNLSEAADKPSQLLEQLRSDSGRLCIYVGDDARSSLGLLLETKDGLSSRTGWVVIWALALNMEYMKTVMEKNEPVDFRIC